MLKRTIKMLANYFGVDIIRPFSSNLARLLNTFNIDLVFDIGANRGQYASKLFKFGYKGSIVSFEPLVSAHTKLLEESKTNRYWYVYNKCAIGSQEGFIDINISENSVSSSILNILEAHTNVAPESKYIGSEKVEIFKLDTVARNYINDYKNIFLKVDTQGYEKQVLDGAAEVIPKIKGLQLELSLLPLYEGQILFDEMMQIVKTMGFSVYSLVPVFTDKDSGRILQVDVIFFRDV